jgi:pentapeptide MXKDX repeat protein
MRKLIIATAALAFIASPAFAQDKAGDKSGTAATSSDTMSKDTMKKTTKTKKASAKKTGDDATKQ